MERSEIEAHEQSRSPHESRRSHNTGKKPAAKNQAVNGSTNSNGTSTLPTEAEPNEEKDAVADVANDLKDATIKDEAEE